MTNPKLYTRTGDEGMTGLFGGERVGKDDPRVETYGTVDELNAAVGLARAAVTSSTPTAMRLAASPIRLCSGADTRPSPPLEPPRPRSRSGTAPSRHGPLALELSRREPRASRAMVSSVFREKPGDNPLN